MSFKVDFTDTEPQADSDIVLKINYDQDFGSAARAFEIAAELIKALEDMDRVFAQTIHVDLHTALIVEDLQKSSLKIFLRNVLKGIPDDALKEVDVKKLIGHYLVKAKYAAIRWLDTPERQNPLIADLTNEIAAIARESDVRHLPDYPAPNATRLAQSLDKFQEAKSKFSDGESLIITLGKDDYTVHLDQKWSPSEKLPPDEPERHLVNEQELFLVIGKPDFLGEAKWTFRHGKKPMSVKIEDDEWLEDFKNGAYPIKPGDALRVRLRIEHKYDAQGNLIESHETIVRVFEVIEGAGPNSDLFDR